MMKNEFETVEIARKDQSDIRFEGKLLAKIDSRQHSRKPDDERKRGTRLELWELRSGDWVATSIAVSDRTGETEFGEVNFIPSELNGIEAIGIMMTVNGIYDEKARCVRAMKFWGWSWLAKEMAKQQGWDVAEVLS